MTVEPNSARDKAQKFRASLHLPIKVPTFSWKELAETLAPVLVLSAVAILLALHFVQPAPPHSLTMSTGPKDSRFESIATQYQTILARSGIKLKLIQSEGSLENMNRLSDPKSGVDITFVQSGIVEAADTRNIASLGSVFYQPLTIFYRSAKELQRLSELNAQRISIGPLGSGTQFLALALLKGNGIEPKGSSTLMNLEGDEAKSALLNHKVEAIFLSGDTASPATTRDMLHAEGIRLFDFGQADAYVRRFPYLSKITVPPGSFDLGENLPPTSINLLAPTVELLAHSNLHPALCDLLIEAAYEVHGKASILQSAGQFPNAATSLFPIHDEAARYYKTGNKSFAYRYLPFWLASLFNRALVVLVPILVVVIPGLRILPQVYSWRVNSRIHRRYGELMALERASLGHLTEERRAALLERLAEIEKMVIKTKMPGSHADQLYILRQHIGFVRINLTRPPTPPSGDLPAGGLAGEPPVPAHA